MGCVYSNHEGYCEIWDKNWHLPGVDINGICICEDDENPEDLCENYEELG